MSRIGDRIISIPENVTVSLEKNILTVAGDKGKLDIKINNKVEVKIKDNQITVITKKDSIESKGIQGTTNSNILNVITGVTKGFEKTLEMVGVGYRFNLQGNKLAISAGYSHPIAIELPEGISVEVVSNTEIKIKGIDKQLVGEFAANVRKIREPEPYKGKGIRYHDENVRRKEGKKAA